MPLLCCGSLIDDTYAEAFRMWAARVVVTAINEKWLHTAAQTVSGYGTSVIACDAEVGVERWLTKDETLDGRPGVAILLFAFNHEALIKVIPKRVGQCLMTCPTTAVYDGLPTATDRVPMGKHLRFFGDGQQKSKWIDGRRYWRIPIMDGEFLCEETCGAMKAIAGGNFQIEAVDQETALASAERAAAAIAPLADVITPFPGGIVSCGSKVGSRYAGLHVSANEVFAPTMRSRVKSQLHDGVNSVLEIVIDGLSEEAIRKAMKLGIEAACGPGVVAISAGNFGGKLGKYHFPLHGIMQGATS
ncbi:MAG TPA: formylmethanofuran--tetrahydromethanopterin N-formyltransferase [Gemmatales bacterium]|nr:formylmethanofuran--tetrahydromethanopterin N-formyltransferase [Gemmatales bacterium]